MLAENSVLRAQARQSLANKWGMAVVTTLVMMLLSGIAASSPIIGTALTILVMLPITWSYYVMFLHSVQQKDFRFEDLFKGFKDYGRILGTMLLTSVYILLWMLLLFVPGVIKAYSYAMTPYILEEEPELSFNAAIEKSMAMMNGHKTKLFLLDLSFIGWILLSCLTFGIGFLWLTPYMYSARAAFYEDLKKELGVTATTTTECPCNKPADNAEEKGNCQCSEPEA